MDPPLVPPYSKPDVPGITMNFDNTVSIYHVVPADDSFEKAAGDLFGLIKEAQERYPDWPRILYLDILGHQGGRLGFDDDFVEFQQEMFFSTMARFLTAFELPLTGPLVNPERQSNTLPDQLVVAPPSP